MAPGPADGDDLAQDAQSVVGADRHRAKFRVLRPELDALVTDEEPFDGSFLIEQRDHDVPTLRQGLLPNHHQVTVVDASIDHAVALDFQCEAASMAGDPAVDQHFADDVFIGQDRLAGSDSADDGDGPQLEHLLRRLPQDGQAAGLSRLSLDVAFAHQLADLVAHARGRYPEDVREFLDGRGKPLPAGETAQLAQCAPLRAGDFLNAWSASRLTAHGKSSLRGDYSGYAQGPETRTVEQSGLSDNAAHLGQRVEENSI